MWQIGELKARGKAAFKANYWKCVVVTVIFSVIGGAIGGVFSSQYTKMFSDPNMFVNMSEEDMIALYMAMAGTMATMSGIVTLVSYLVLNPLTVGGGRFYLCNSYAPAEVSELGYGFTKGNYGRSVLALFLESLLLAVGSLVIIPALILPYSYRLVPYLIADDPSISAVDALKKSRQMMKGNKWKSFVLDLSFIGWILLGCFTLGILYIFYVIPYMSATEAELYRAIKGDGGVAVNNFVPEGTDVYGQPQAPVQDYAPQTPVQDYAPQTPVQNYAQPQAPVQDVTPDQNQV